MCCRSLFFLHVRYKISNTEKKKKINDEEYKQTHEREKGIKEKKKEQKKIVEHMLDTSHQKLKYKQTHSKNNNHTHAHIAK